MTKRKYNNILILVVFTLYVAYYRFILSIRQSYLVDAINVASVAVMAFIAILLLGFRKDKMTGIKKSILGMTISEILIFFAISYGLGYITGFMKNSYVFDLETVVGSILSPILYVIGIEIFRYTILNANNDKKLVTFITTILIIILELTIGLREVMMYDFETTFTTVASIILPIIIKNIALSYVTIHGGLKPVLIYRLVMDIYGYVLPIVPDLGDYISSIIGILLPTLVYMYSSRIVDGKSHESEEEHTSRKTLRLSDLPVTIFIVLLVALISGRFSFAIIGVGSESMSPKIDKGDAVLYQKVKKESDMKIGDVLVFRSGSKMIIHRLVDIKRDGDKNYYITKGDANNSNDSLNLSLNNIEGKVILKLKYLAYPSLWFKDMVDKR